MPEPLMSSLRRAIMGARSSLSDVDYFEGVIAFAAVSWANGELPGFAVDTKVDGWFGRLLLCR